jgi:transcriptional regulator with XRE-family HTH domain
MAELDPGKVIRHVRRRLNISQEGLSRLLNATKGAIQHWERGRNRPDLARLQALRQFCPAGPERKQLDELIRQTQARVAPFPTDLRETETAQRGRPALVPTRTHKSTDLEIFRRQNQRLTQQLNRQQSTIEQKSERIHTLENLVKELQGDLASWRSKGASATSGKSS